MTTGKAMHTASADVRPVYAVVGHDRLLRQEALEGILRVLSDEMDTLGPTRVDGTQAQLAGCLQCRGAAAGAFPGYSAYCQLDGFLRRVNVMALGIKDDVYRNWFSWLPPAVVIGGTANDSVADFGFPCQPGFGQGSHADKVGSPGAVES